MRAHTPGPWRAEFRNHDARIIAEAEHEVAGVWTLRSTSGERDQNRDVMVANARLIAAAPELLDALEKLLWRLDNPPLREEAHGEICETDPCERCEARAAIKKARGQ